MAPILSLLIPSIVGIIDKIIPDKDAAAKAQLELTTMAMKGELDQITNQLEVNKAEASTGSLFIGGWRPFIGWICGTAFAYTYVVLPIVTFAYTSYTGHALPVEPPTLDNNLYELLFGMLGLGGLRTLEKIKGVTK